MRGIISAVLCFVFLVVVAPEAMAGGSCLAAVKKASLLTVVIEESDLSDNHKKELLNFLESGRKLAVSGTMENNRSKKRQLANDAYSILGKVENMLEEYKVSAKN